MKQKQMITIFDQQQTNAYLSMNEKQNEKREHLCILQSRNIIHYKYIFFYFIFVPKCAIPKHEFQYVYIRKGVWTLVQLEVIFFFTIINHFTEI